MRYVIGDVHGCYKSLRKLVEDILKLNKADELYFVGDFIDRGPSAKQVVDYLIWLKDQGYLVQSVRGNHEEMLIDAFSHQTSDKYMLWMFNGASTTLESYGIESHKYMEQAALNELSEEHIEFFRKLPYYIELDDYIIVHAGINFQAEEPFKDTHSMVWCRECDNDLLLSGNRTIVHGHTPTPLEDIQKRASVFDERQLNIDAGCVYKDFTGMGNLAAIELGRREVYATVNIDF